MYIKKWLYVGSILGVYKFRKYIGVSSLILCSLKNRQPSLVVITCISSVLLLFVLVTNSGLHFCD